MLSYAWQKCFTQELFSSVQLRQDITFALDYSLGDDSGPVVQDMDMDIARPEPIDDSFGDDAGPVVEDFDITRAVPIVPTVILERYSCY